MRIFFPAILFLCFSLQLNARILRVGLKGIAPVTNVDFANFRAAYNYAVNGDTIYVFPGSTLDGPQWPNQWPEIAKRLIIISKGNWLDNTATPKGNPGLQASKGTATIGAGAQDLYFKPGSKGSVLMGFNCQQSGGGAIHLQDDSITIKRNYDCLIFFDNYSLKNLVIEGNYRVWFGGNHDITNVYKDINIINNFIYQFRLPLKAYTGLIKNNTWAYDGTNTANGGNRVMSYFDGNTSTSFIDLRGGTWIFQSNLMVSYFNVNGATNSNWFAIENGQSSVFNYNVALQSDLIHNWPGTGTGNVFLNPANVGAIFEGFPAIGTRSADDRYILKAGSPANMANRNGSEEDAGMFGGSFPYKLSNIPSIPTIYGLSSPQGNTVTGGTIQINISARSNN